MDKFKITYSTMNRLVNRMRERIRNSFPVDYGTICLYAVPRGGVPVALALAGTGNFMLVDNPDAADVIVDDLIDSGATMARFKSKPFFALLDKRVDTQYAAYWLEFPWEAGSDGGIEDNITRLLQYVGEDATRGGLAETPQRVAKAWQHWCSGYGKDPADVLKVFEDGAENYDEMVVVKDIPFHSHCEHHMAPFFGRATIAYVPNGRVVGLSKLNRLLDVFARRLQVQERLTTQVADALMEHLVPKGCGVLLQARHMCIESRGVAHHGAATTTSALRGVFKDQSSTRSEFLALAHSTKPL